MPSRNRLAALILATATAGAVYLPGFSVAQPHGGTVERIRVHGPALEGNLAGDDATREVFVYLPPSYTRETARRYPVVYFLHGYTATAESYVRYLDLPQAADRAVAAG